MKKSLFLFAFIYLFLNLQLKALDASVNFATFKSPQQNYVEIYLHVIGSTVNFTKIDSTQQQAAVNVLLLLKQGEKIIKFDKYRLSSPIGKEIRDFIDLKRYALADGLYSLEVSFEDVSDPANKRTIKKNVEMKFTGGQLEQSDIELLADVKQSKEENLLVKNGLFMEPLPFNFYDKRKTQLIFYNEVYGADQYIGGPFLARYLVEEIKNDGTIKTSLIANKKIQARPISIILAQLDIKDLPTGNYQLKIEIRNRENELLSERKINFQRANPYLKLEAIANEDLAATFTDSLDREELRYGLRAIAMHVPNGDVEVINLMVDKKSEAELVAMRRYLFNFWAQQAPNGPEQAYDKYMEVAKAVDKQFNSGFRAGFETDRGWLYMKYGRPDDMLRESNELGAPPYEIWVYYEIKRTNERNVKFLFYNPTLAAEDFRLLHSTSRFELQNPNWQNELYRDEAQPIGGGGAAGNDGRSMSFTKRAVEYFNDL